jgi:hypothetical protein
MKLLSQAAFKRARLFLRDQARLLDKALFKYRFENASSQQVIAELGKYQNSDGGFGHGLEPDMRTPGSSSLATGLGLQILKEVGCSSEHPMVRQAIDYIVENYNQQLVGWRVVPGDANEYPHAPWWHDDNGSLAEAFDGYRIIPRAQIAGLLVDYSDLVLESWLDELLRTSVDHIVNVDKLGTGGGDDLLYASQLAETRGLPEDLRKPLRERILLVAPGVISRNPDEWASYAITPLKVAPSPDSIAADTIRDEIEMHLDYQIENQSPEGFWRPTWSWGDLFPDVWKRVEVEWQAHLTLETLTSLRDYNRIERFDPP